MVCNQYTDTSVFGYFFNIKNEYCKKNNIPLYRFAYAESRNDIENKIINIVNRNDCGTFMVT